MLYDLIPTMSGNTSPTGEASASSVGWGMDPWAAFAKSFGTYWHSNNSPTPHWLKYQFPVSAVVIGFSMWPRGDAWWMPQTWKFQGSNDNTNWTTLQEQSSPASWYTDGTNGGNPYGNMPNYFWFNNTTAYTYYRITDIGTTNGGTYCVIMDMRMYGWYSSDYPPIDRGFLEGVGKKPCGLVSLIPPMSSDTTPRGVCSAGTVYGAGNEAYKAFSGDPADHWHSAYQAGIASWIKYEFDKPVVVVGYSMRPRPNHDSRHPLQWNFKGSEDGIYWTTLDTRSSQSWTGPTDLPKYYFFDNKKPYKYYKLADYYGSTDYNYGMVCDLKMYGYDGYAEDQLSNINRSTTDRAAALSTQLDYNRRR